ncbi:UvrB/UvrC motif-containing protein [Desulfoscipio sp. XC116]|uniref:UvrB/UvrC motif-containing protein n=1 Tax=Desulfoscipio sp. XC116 TaxID=3144975 RepID=UPI00325B0A07
MLCERCHERPATVHYTEIVNGHKTKMHLCEVCAGQMQAGGLVLMPQINLHNILASFLSQTPPAHSFAAETRQENSCPTCGTTENLFAQKGLLGCGDCYRHFGDRLEPLMRRIHGSSSHAGKVPERTGGRVKMIKQINDIKGRLQQAVVREEFEMAAQLRDQIRQLEQQLSGGEDSGN